MNEMIAMAYDIYSPVGPVIPPENVIYIAIMNSSKPSLYNEKSSPKISYFLSFF